MGKTDFITNLILGHCLSGDVPAALFSAESNQEAVIDRCIAINAGIAKSHLRSNLLAKEEWDKLAESVNDLRNMPLYIDTRAFLSIEDIIEKTRKLVSENGVRIIYVDPFQLIRNKSMELTSFSRHDYVSKIVMDLKALAIELDIAVVVISKMNRNIESDGRIPKASQLNDLRESGAIEDTSDIVLFIDRPEVYRRSYEDECGNDIRGVSILYVEKIRGTSERDDIKLFYDSKTGRYLDWEEYMKILEDKLPPIDSHILDGPAPF